MNKKNPTFSFSDPELQKTIKNTTPVFDKISTLYDDISKDILGVEEFLNDKGVKSTFVFNFHRDNYLGGNEVADGGWEALDWRYDPPSKKFRLMVSQYCFLPPDVTGENYENPSTDLKLINIYETISLIQSTINTRLYYHPRLEPFISTFSKAIESALKVGDMVRGIIFEDEINRTENSDGDVIYKRGSFVGYLPRSELQDERTFKQPKPKKKTAGPDG